MSRYYKRTMHPQFKLLKLIGKLIGHQRVIGPTGTHAFKLKHTDHIVVFSPQWITESA